jgi:cellulose synthase/poly-beta-1,6-N-acetylglucosamine synthase-like glycosyltransferase
MWLAMELKKTEQTNFRYITYHLLITAVCLQMLLLPGHVFPRYYMILGTAVFAAIVFCSARSYLLAFFAMKKNDTYNRLPDELPRVSLIIPSFNEETVLKRTIPTALAMDYPPDKLELIYVYESACTDRTEQIIQAFASQDSRIKAVRRMTQKGGKAAVTNHGLQFATGDIIGIFDADHSLNSDLVRLAVAQLQAPNVKCVRGWCRTINRTQNLVTRLVALERDVVERFCIYGAWRMGGFSTSTGGHAFFRREVFDEFGLFNEDILTEDIDFSVKLHSAGYQIAVLPQMQSWEEAPTSLRSLVNQRKRWTRGWIQVWRMHATRILKAKKAALFKRIDVLVSLTCTVISGLLVILIPLRGLSALGFRTSCFDENLSFLLWLFAATTPGLISLLMWCLSRNEENPSGPEDLLLIPLLIPYIIFWFCISWICLVDEFVLSWPFAYVKTERAEEYLVPAELETDPVAPLTDEEQVVEIEEIAEGLKVGSSKSLDT